MRRDRTGRYASAFAAGETVSAFIPAPLPPSPPLVIEGDLQRALEPAHLAIGRLDGASTRLPDRALFL